MQTLISGIKTAVQTVAGLAATSDCYLSVDGAALPPTSGRPCLGIRPAGTERSEVSVSGCRWEVLHTVELVAHVAMTGTAQATAMDSAFDLLDAASGVLNHNNAVRTGVVAALIGGDSSPSFVRDTHGRWNVRITRTMTYTIEEML